MKNPKTKLFALILSLAMLAILFLPFNPQVVGLHTSNCSPYGEVGRGLYSFFHANFLHYLLNTWCFLSCVFLADTPFKRLVLAYLIAVSAPALSATPTIGLSGVCYALLGMTMWQSSRKLRYNIIIGVSIALVSLLCPKAVNNVLHAYCYLLAAFLTAPLHKGKPLL